jgi:hypothetical protein
VAAALQVKVHRAKLAGAPHIELWGTGTPRREFLFVDDLADAPSVPDAALFRRGAHQRWHRGGHYDHDP